MTIGFVIKNSVGLYYSNKYDMKAFMPFDKHFVIIYNREVNAIDEIEGFLFNDLYTIERVISTL